MSDSRKKSQCYCSCRCMQKGSIHSGRPSVKQRVSPRIVHSRTLISGSWWHELACTSRSHTGRVHYRAGCDLRDPGMRLEHQKCMLVITTIVSEDFSQEMEGVISFPMQGQLNDPHYSLMVACKVTFGFGQKAAFLPSPTFWIPRQRQVPLLLPCSEQLPPCPEA